MSSIFSINNLNYSIDDRVLFNNFNLEIEKGSWTSIIAPNKSGKTILTKLICAVIPTYDVFELDSIILNKENVLNYITKIGIVSNDFNNLFLCKKVKDELKMPLKNLGYSNYKINKKIEKISKFFQIGNLLNLNINSLEDSLKNKLLIIISLIHNPNLLVLDDAFNNMNQSDQNFMLKKLKELTYDGLTILNITSNLETIYESNKVYIMDKFEIKKSGSVKEIFCDDSYLNKIGLKIPFIVDLSLKLNLYKLVDNIYFNIDELEENLWK